MNNIKTSYPSWFSVFKHCCPFRTLIHCNKHYYIIIIYIIHYYTLCPCTLLLLHDLLHIEHKATRWINNGSTVAVHAANIIHVVMNTHQCDLMMELHLLGSAA